MVKTLIGDDMFSRFFNMTGRAWQFKVGSKFDAQVEGFIVDGSNHSSGTGKRVWKTL